MNFLFFFQLLNEQIIGYGWYDQLILTCDDDDDEITMSTKVWYIIIIIFTVKWSCFVCVCVCVFMSRMAIENPR